MAFNIFQRKPQKHYLLNFILHIWIPEKIPTFYIIQVSGNHGKNQKENYLNIFGNMQKNPLFMK